MLKLLGNFYSNNKEDFDELAEALENAGFTIACQENSYQGVIMTELLETEGE